MQFTIKSRIIYKYHKIDMVDANTDVVSKNESYYNWLYIITVVL